MKREETKAHIMANGRSILNGSKITNRRSLLHVVTSSWGDHGKSWWISRKLGIFFWAEAGAVSIRSFFCFRWSGINPLFTFCCCLILPAHDHSAGKSKMKMYHWIERWKDFIAGSFCCVAGGSPLLGILYIGTSALDWKSWGVFTVKRQQTTQPRERHQKRN